MVTLHRTSLPNLAFLDEDTPLVLVPAGRYRNLGSQQIRSARPEYDAEVSAFWIEVFPVTIPAYVTFVRSGEYALAFEWEGDAPEDVLYGPDGVLKRLVAARRDTTLFAVHLDFFEAAAYARSRRLRLPNETEWEIALRHQASASLTGGSDLLPHLDSSYRTLLYKRLSSPALRTHLSNVQFSALGCAQYFLAFAEWTADVATVGYYHGYFPLRTRFPGVLSPAPDTEMSVRGRVPLAQAPSAVLRYGRRAGLDEQVFDFPIGFRCVVDDGQVVLQD